MLRAKKCKRCGKVFTPINRNSQQYCSFECGYLIEGHYHPRIKFEKICGVCGCKYTTFFDTQLYCCEECSNEAARRRKIAFNAQFSGD